MLAVAFTQNGATAVLPRHPRAAAQARRVLDRAVTGPDAPTEAAALLLSELIANAVRHASGPLVLVAIVHDEAEDCLVGAVFDGDPELHCGIRCGERHPEDLESGRGLDLLDTLAGAWGVAPLGEHGKWVWFRLYGTAA